MLYGYVIGMLNGRANTYRIMTYTGETGQWKFKVHDVTEEQVIQVIKEGKLRLHNATVEGNRLKGTTGALSRFKGVGGVKPVVLLSEIRAVNKDSSRLIGYRITTGDNPIIKAVKLGDILNYCAKMRASNSDIIPIQNAMYVEDTVAKKFFIRLYPDQSIPVEEVMISKAKAVKPAATVDASKNEQKIGDMQSIFDEEQLKQLTLGKKNGVDIRIYGNPKLSAKQMQQIRKSLEENIDPTPFNSPEFSAGSMQAYRLNIKYGVDITYFVHPNYTPEHIYELSTAYINGVNVRELADPNMKIEEMTKKRVYLESMLWGKEIEPEKAEEGLA